jgi:fumarate hydratase class II
MDAVPLTLGQEFSGYAQMVGNGVRRINGACPALYELALGATAVGTGLGNDPALTQAVIAEIGRETGLPFRQAPNLFEALAGRDALVELSAALRSLAISLTKIANDVRWLGSGPRCGLGELRLPELQPGSSIMPGKVNPVMPEMLLMVCAQVVGFDTTVAWAGAAGILELNAMIPLITHNVLTSIELLGRAAALFTDKCVSGLQANREHCAALVEQSLALVTALAPRLGYDAAAAIARESSATGKTIRELCIEKAVLPADELAGLLDARRMTGA